MKLTTQHRTEAVVDETGYIVSITCPLCGKTTNRPAQKEFSDLEEDQQITLTCNHTFTFKGMQTTVDLEES